MIVSTALQYPDLAQIHFATALDFGSSVVSCFTTLGISVEQDCIDMKPWSE